MFTFKKQLSEKCFGEPVSSQAFVHCQTSQLSLAFHLTFTDSLSLLPLDLSEKSDQVWILTTPLAKVLKWQFCCFD